MSVELDQIDQRLQELLILMNQGILPQNAAVNYIKDVTGLLSAVNAMRVMVTDMMRKLDDKQDNPPKKREFYLNVIDTAIAKLLIGDFKTRPVLERPN